MYNNDSGSCLSNCSLCKALLWTLFALFLAAFVVGMVLLINASAKVPFDYYSFNKTGLTEVQIDFIG